MRQTTAVFASSNLKSAARYVLGAAFIAAGANHFLHTAFYTSIMPAYLPWHEALVYVSGVLEMAFGALLFVRPVERLAAWGVFVLTIAVFPANVQMALHSGQYPQFSPLILWLRLPLQLVLLAWAYWLTRAAAPVRRAAMAHTSTD